MFMPAWRRWLKRRTILGHEVSRRQKKSGLRPWLELLEQRVTPDSGGAAGQLANAVPAPDLIYNGFGPLLNNVQIEPIFVTDAGTGSVSPYQTQLDNFFNTITTDSYIPTLLSQYTIPGFTPSTGSKGADDTSASYTPDTTDGPYNAYSDGFIQTIVQGEVQNGNTATETANTLYFVFTPPGDAVVTGFGDSISSFLGYHSSFVDINTGNPVYYAVIPDQQTSGPNANLSVLGMSADQGEETVSTHEMSEAITDPTPNTEFTDPNYGEVGDMAVANIYTQDGYGAQYEWSQQALGIAHAFPSAGNTSTLFINQLTPPAVDGTVEGPMATFTDSNPALTKADFSATVDFGDGNGPQPATIEGGTDGVYAVFAATAGLNPLPDGQYGTPFGGPGGGAMNVEVQDTLDGGFPLSVRYTPYAVTNAPSPLVYNADAGGIAHDFRLVQNGISFELYDHGTLVFTQPVAQTTSIDINADPGVDSSLTVDYSGGQFTNQVNFDGGTGTGTHTLTIENGSFGNETYTYTSPTAGNVQLDGENINFVDTNAIADTTTTLSGDTFVLPAGVQGSLQDDGNNSNGISELVSPNSTFVPTTFTNPPGVTLDAGGSDLVNLAPMDSGFAPAAEVFNGISGDVFQLTNAGALTATNQVAVNSATLDLNGLSPGISSLGGNGTVGNSVAKSVTLTINGSFSNTFSGVIQNGNGTTSLIMSGSGTQTLSGNNTYTGATTILGGTLQVDGSISSNVTLAGGTLSGDGSTGKVSGASGGVSPGDGSTPGTLSTGPLSLPVGTSFTATNIGGNTAGNGVGFYPQEMVIGTISLGGTLNLPTSASGYTPAVNDVYVIIDNALGNGAVSGTFVAGAGINLPAGTALPEGTFLSNNFLGSGLVAYITYKAGPSADSVAIVVGVAPTITSNPSTTFTVGVPGSYQLTGTGSPAPSFSLSSNAPSWLSINGSNQLVGTPPNLGAGPYAFTFTITAGNGVNPSFKQTFTLTVDQAPKITSASSATFTVGNDDSFQLTATGNPAPTFSLSANAPAWVSVNSSNQLVTSPTPNLGSGPYVFTFTITASNGIGTNDTQTFTLTVHQAPKITSANNTTFTVGNNDSFQLTATGNPSASFSLSANAPSWLTVNSSNQLVPSPAPTPDLGSGPYVFTFTITASNGVGSNDTQTFTLTVHQAAKITSANNHTFTVGTPDTFTVTTTGNPQPSLSDGGFSLPSGLTFADQGNGTATLSGTPRNLGAGPYVFPFTITAHNGIGGDFKQKFTLTIDQAPAITSNPTVGFITGTPGSFTVTTTGFPVPSITSSVLPSGVSLKDNGNGTATLSSTAAAAQGIYTFTITGQNGVGSAATQTFTLTIGAPPSFTSANNAAFTAGTPGTFNVTASGFPAPTFSQSGAPAFVSLASSGQMSVTPSSSSAGQYVFTIRAVNGVGSPATQKFTLTINPPVSFTPTPTAGLVPGTLNNIYNQSILAVGGTGAKILNYSVIGTLPAGLGISPNSGVGNPITVSSGSSPPTATGTATIHVMATDSVGASATATFTVRIVNIAIVPDFLSPGLTMLVVGTPASDTKGTTIQPVDAAGDLSVYTNGSTTPASILVGGVGQASARPTGHILVYCNGADAIHLKMGPSSVTVTVPAFLVGGAGNDTLDAAGSSANNVLLGGNGVNSLKGGSGNDILIGGPNYGVLFGGSGQDILLSGTTSYGQNITALNALMTEWGKTNESISTRQTNLQNGTGANGSYVLNANTIQTDVPQELIVPGSSQNWLINAPLLIGTLEGGGNVTFSWSLVNGAATYQLLLVDTTLNQTVGTTVVTGTSAQVQTYSLPTAGLIAGHHYRWWITPVTAGSKVGVKSSPLDFVVT
jgi:autotransporter-associated beta strand protein